MAFVHMIIICLCGEVDDVRGLVLLEDGLCLLLALQVSVLGGEEDPRPVGPPAELSIVVDDIAEAAAHHAAPAGHQNHLQ